MLEVTLDFETRSECDLKRAGSYKYARHPSTEVLCVSYAFGAAEPQLWHPGCDAPQDLFDAIAAGAPVVAHHASFERNIWLHVCAARMNWPKILLKQWRCTMGAAANRGLPLGLDVVSRVLNLGHKKDTAAAARVKKAWSPNKAKASKKNPNPPKWIEDPETLATMHEYCRDDVRAERDLDKVVGRLPAREQAIWRLDQVINERGVRIDVPAVEAAISLVEQVEEKMIGRFAALTAGTGIEKPSQVARIQTWLHGRGIHLDDLTADTVKLTLQRADLPDLEREVLQIRQALSLASTKKLQAMLDCVCDDGRARGLLQYHGAVPTGRWAGRLIQPQNFKRPTNAYEGADPDNLIAAISTRDPEFVAAVYGDPMEAVSMALRGYFVAADGATFAAGDFSAIEAVITAAVAGCERKLNVFRDGKDPYCVFAEKVFGHAVAKKTHPAERTVGKMGELAFGFGGGVGAWRNFEPAGPSVHTDDDIKGYRDVWREAHPEIKELWYGLESAAVRTVQTRRPHSYRSVEYFMAPDGDWLGCRITPDRVMWYREPRVVEAQMPWDDFDGNPVFKPQLQYRAFKPAKGGWIVVRAWGGHLTENVVQGIARELMVEAMFRLEREHMPLVLTVHDEAVTEGQCRDPKALEQIMAVRPEWARDWPLRANAWIGDRYRK